MSTSLTQKLISHLSNFLPNYIIPSFFIFLDIIPLTPNAKVDRKSLSTSNIPLQGTEKKFVRPQTSVERLLLECWTEVLNYSKISITDNFFEIGGDSIQSIRLLATAKSRGISFNIKDVFNFPTIAQLIKLQSLQKP